MTPRRTLPLLLAAAAALALTASAAAAPPTKRLRIDVVDAGTVTLRPRGLVCTGSCDTRVRLGNRIALVATPDAGHELLQWGGACRGQVGPRCVLTVRHPLYVFATFVRIGEGAIPPP
ncbi:MAG: hypothetical protein R3C15_21795 [Thermoleophilia bacterium]